MLTQLQRHHVRAATRWVLALVVAGAVVSGCAPPTRGSADEDAPGAKVAAVPAPSPATAERPDDSVLSEAKGKTLSNARALLESRGWKVKTKATKNRTIKKKYEKNWQVTAVKKGKQGTVTLTAGKLTFKTEKIAFKTKTMRLDEEPLGHKQVTQKGTNGSRRHTYLDGNQIRTKVTKEPVAKIVEIGMRPWVCDYDPTYDYDWHNDVLCRSGSYTDRPYLRSWDRFVTYGKIMASAREHEARLNS